MQYEELCKKNKDEISYRKGEKYKQLKKLDEVSETSPSSILFGTVLHNCLNTKENSIDDEIYNKAKSLLFSLSQKSRELLSFRIGHQIGFYLVEELSPCNSLRFLRDKFTLPATYIKLLEDNIRKFGVIIPILITNSKEIIDGYYRWKISGELGINKIPTIEINTNGLLYKQKLYLMISLWLSSNLLHRQLTNDDSRVLKRYLTLLNTDDIPRGRPSDEEQRLLEEFHTKGIDEMSIEDMNLLTLLYRRDINEVL